MSAKINNIYLYDYGKPQLSVGVSFGGGDSASFIIKDDDILAVMAVIWEIIERKKFEMAEKMTQLETPVALIGHEKPTINETPVIRRDLDKEG
jgi:hypothetical protein